MIFILYVYHHNNYYHNIRMNPKIAIIGSRNLFGSIDFTDMAKLTKEENLKISLDEKVASV